ncbi:unnamed protein product, partial [Nesidiocoris tenuis]
MERTCCVSHHFATHQVTEHVTKPSHVTDLTEQYLHEHSSCIDWINLSYQARGMSSERLKISFYELE